MKLGCLTIYFLLIMLAFFVQARETNNIPEIDYIELCSHVINTEGETNIWRISPDALKKIPSWNMDNSEPPLSINSAIKIAKKWIISKGCENNSWIVYVMIRPIRSTDRGQISYYNILFGGVGIFGHYRRCIVLMDGTVVEPVWLYRKMPKPSEYYYFDE